MAGRGGGLFLDGICSHPATRQFSGRAAGRFISCKATVGVPAVDAAQSDGPPKPEWPRLTWGNPPVHVSYSRQQSGLINQGCTTRANPFQDFVPKSVLNYFISSIIF